MAKTPHSSWNLSNIVFQRLIPTLSELLDAPLDQNVSTVPDGDPAFDRAPDPDRRHGMPGCDLEDPCRVRRGYQYSRRAFVEQQQLEAQVRIEIDFGAHGRRSELGFGHGH